jgi:hypothetical protein
LGKKIFTNLWEFKKERDFKFIMGVVERIKSLESNLFLYPTLFPSDSSGKGMGA